VRSGAHARGLRLHQLLSMEYLSSYLFTAAGILGVVVLALMGRRHIRLPRGYGREGTTVWRRRD
jgi:hypothetical protein